MSDSFLRYPHRNSQTRTRSGSEAIRRRVAQLMERSNINIVPAAEGSMARSRERSRRRNCPVDGFEELSKNQDLENKLPPFEPSGRHAPKRKDVSEITMASTITHSKPTLSSVTHISDQIFFHGISHEKEGTHSPQHSHIQVDDLSGRFEGKQAEHASLRKEIDALKKALRGYKLATQQQVNKIEEMKAELSSTLSSLHVQEQEVLTLKDTCRKKDELLSTIESSINCQICMDLPNEPYTLSPCGHVLCLQCLQEWFRRAPSTLDDSDAESEDVNDHILLRSKSCPSCRAVIKHRPAPAYMVKAVASTLLKSRPINSCGKVHAIQDTPAFSMGDLWKGIFPSEPEESEDDESDELDIEVDSAVNHESDDDEDNLEITFRAPRYRLPYRIMDSSDSGIDGSSDVDDDLIDSSSDDEQPNHARRYITSRSVQLSMETVPVELRTATDDEEDLELLRRGCTSEMIDTHDITYSPQAGIVVYLRSIDSLDRHNGSGDVYGGHSNRWNKNRIFLGWNIFLEEEDVDGSLYLTNVLADIKRTPTRWRISTRPGRSGVQDIQRFIQGEDGSGYDTTDSESFLDAEE